MDHRNNASIDWVLKASASSTLSPSPPSATTAPKSCRLIVGPVAFLAQIVLLVVVILALIIKRSRERPRRPWNIWLLDISKQWCSGAAGHAVGMIVAILASASSSVSEGDKGGGSECGWYFVVYFADASLGITLALTFHKLTTSAARYAATAKSRSSSSSTSWTALAAGGGGGEKDGQEHPWWEALVEIGNYGDPPSYKKWGVQVFFWVLSVVTARLIVGLVVISNLSFFRLVTLKMDARFQHNPDAYLFIIMVGIPVTFNILQAMIQDQVLKFKTARVKLKDEGAGGGVGGGSPNLKEKRSGGGMQQVDEAPP